MTPLRSVTRRPTSDPRILDELLVLHASANPRILDASWAHGRIWRGLRYRPVRLDARAELDIDVVGNWCDLASHFPPATFDVVVWDPPHINDAGQGIVGAASWGDTYGTRSIGLQGANISHLFAPFLASAQAVLEPVTGIVIAKIADQVHGGARQWQPFDFVAAARVAGFTPCDLVVKARTSSLTDPKWARQYHARSSTFWIVVRNGPSCSGPGVGLLLRCEVCGRAFRSKRRDARTDGAACRQRLHRRGVSAP